MKNPKVDFYFTQAQKWQAEIEALRSIVLETGLTEELKWGCPCYTLSESNIVLIHVFKEYCALLFFKGALISDPKGILIQQTKNVQAARQMRFTKVSEVNALKKNIIAYIQQAIKIEKAGLKVALKKTEDYPVPIELKQQFDASAALKKAFEQLTPGRQRAYLYYFSQPKQSSTRTTRIEKSAPSILAGKGLNE